MFLSSTYYGMWLFISLFVGFCVSDSKGNAASISERSLIKSLFVSMLRKTWNLRYFMIIICVGFEPFFLTINLDVVSSSNVFSNLIFVFRYKSIVVLNQ